MRCIINVKMNTITTDCIKWRCLPLHLNFSSFRASILRRCILLGVSHRAPDVSIGLWWRYSANHFKLQSQINGFLAKCLQLLQSVKIMQNTLNKLKRYSVWMLLKESKLPLAKDCILLSYKDLKLRFS